MIVMYDIKFTKKAKKFLDKQDTITKERIKNSLLKLAENPKDNIKNDIKLLKGLSETAFRLRVGDIRIVYKLDDDHSLIIVVIIDSRGQIYKRL